MITANSVVMNLLYIILSSLLLWRQLKILNKIHRQQQLREEQLQSGIWPLIRLAPYSAMVSTMLFAFGALLHGSLHFTLMLDNFNHIHPTSMSGSLLFLINLRNICFLGGAFASAAHKQYIYDEKSAANRGKPPRGLFPEGKANGHAEGEGDFTVPDTYERPDDLHRHN